MNQSKPASGKRDTENKVRDRGKQQQLHFEFQEFNTDQDIITIHG